MLSGRVLVRSRKWIVARVCGAVLCARHQLRRIAWHSLLWRAVLAISAVGVLVAAALGRQLPAEHVVDLQFPLRNSVYSVVGGGSVELLNPHLMTLTEERFRAYRGQSYANDLLKLGAYGTRASGWLPADPARMAGNRVLLECPRAARAPPACTVRARRDEWIDAGAIIGLVGNSGNSNEPHLHVHAQRPAPGRQEPLSGDPLPMRFKGRYLVRNDRVTAVER